MSSSNKFSWVSGKVFVLEKCGDIFEYSATGCGNLEMSDGGISIKNAVSVYLETLRIGLDAERQLLVSIHSKRKIVPFPSSGKKLMFGEEALPLELRGNQWLATQSQSPRATCYRLANQPEKKRANCITFNESDESVDVVVKVASISVHKSYLIHPAVAWRAMKNAFLLCKMEDQTKSDRALKTDKNRKWDIFSILFAAEKLPYSLITVMADLSKDYKMLTPKGCRTDLLRVVVRLSRLPFLAELCIIHPDIRAGWNVTSNVLFRKQNVEERCPTPAMQMIDYNKSYRAYGMDLRPVPTWPSMFQYMARGNNNWSPFAFLWWQKCSDSIRMEGSTRSK